MTLIPEDVLRQLRADWPRGSKYRHKDSGAEGTVVQVYLGIKTNKPWITGLEGSNSYGPIFHVHPAEKLMKIEERK